MDKVDNKLKSNGRSSGIQTHDLTHPKGARYQAALYSAKKSD